MQLMSPSGWEDYELIDSGNGEKLERFGKYLLARPEPQALWRKELNEEEWTKISHATFTRESGNSEKGKWILKKGMPENWWIKYKLDSRSLHFKLGLTSFKHVGIFPEQADNWEFIYQQSMARSQSKILNLFAYTGGASLAAKAAGAAVVHLDSVKPIVTWARENMEKTGLDGISWVLEDALKFVRREATRGKKYQGIVLDPPAYGRGPKGEKWVLEESLPLLLEDCNTILDKKGFLVLNLYSMGLSVLVAESLISSIFPKSKPEIGELYFNDNAKRKLPLGIFCRFSFS